VSLNEIRLSGIDNECGWVSILYNNTNEIESS